MLIFENKNGVKQKALFILIPILLAFLSSAVASNLPNKRPKADIHCFDFAGVLKNDTVDEINKEARAIKGSFDMDFVVVIVEKLEGDISLKAEELFSNWKIGKGTKGKKGLLFLISLSDRKAKIEVGYDLEGIYTDAYVGDIERNIMIDLLEQSDFDKAFLATIESFLFRIFENNLQDEVANLSEDNKGLAYYSGGAGAVGVFEVGAAIKRPLPDNYNEIKSYFSAQPTPKKAFERYMELCARAIRHNNDLSIFTDLSNDFWMHWTHSRGQSISEARDASGKPYFIRQKGRFAVVFFSVKDMKALPMYFLRKSDKGWQVDINTMTRTLRCVGPGWWAMYYQLHPYSRIIMEKYNLVHGFLVPWDSDMEPFPFYFSNQCIKLPGLSGSCLGVFEDNLEVKTGDLVLEVNGKRIKNEADFIKIFPPNKDLKVGDRFLFKVMRGIRVMELDVTIKKPADGWGYFRKCLEVPRPWIGVYMIGTLDEREWKKTIALRNAGRIPYDSQCYISEVAPNSPAEKAGLRPGDIICDYGKEYKSGEIEPRDVAQFILNSNPGDKLNFTVLRNLRDLKKITVEVEQTDKEGYF